MRTLKADHYEMRPLHEFKVTRKVPVKPRSVWSYQQFTPYSAFNKNDADLLAQAYLKIKY